MIDSILRAFEYGVDYGLLIAEQEGEIARICLTLFNAVFIRKKCADHQSRHSAGNHGAMSGERQWRRVSRSL